MKNPVGSNFQKAVCERLGFDRRRVRYHYAFDKLVGVEYPRTQGPVNVLPTQAIGNCFFNSVAWFITGNDPFTDKVFGKLVCFTYYLAFDFAMFSLFSQLRKAVCSNIEESGAALLPPEFNEDGKSYVKATKMRLLSTYATNVEVQATADLLNVTIYVFGNETGPIFRSEAPMPEGFSMDLWNWKRIAPSSQPDWLDGVSAQGDGRAIFLRLRGNHYEPVMSMEEPVMSMEDDE